MSLNSINFQNKVVLEIGCGRGETTRQLAAHMTGGGGKLIVTDISDEHFDALRADLAPLDLSVEFVRTSPLKLAGIRPSSIDLLVCKAALSAINAIAGQGELALQKMYSVLKPGGTIYSEEELPFYMAASPSQAIWAEKWRLIKAAQILAGARPSNEYQPDVLEALVRAVGFEEIDISDEIAIRETAEWFPPLKAQFDNILFEIDDSLLKSAINDSMQSLTGKALAIESVEIPYYILTAKKPWRID